MHHITSEGREAIARIIDEHAEPLRAKLRETKRYLRAANRGAQTNALVAQLSAARNAQLIDRLRGQPNEKGLP